MKSLPGLDTACFGRCLVSLPEVDSTNNYCKEHAAFLPHGAAVMAERQHAGKGSGGKSWSDAPGMGLACSLLLKQDIEGRDLPLLPLLVGVGVCRGLNRLCGEHFALKWSNDVLWNDQKVCGILCESRISSGGDASFAVAGFGVNLSHSREDFMRLDLVYAGSLLLATGNLYSAEQTACAVLNALEPLWERCRASGFSAVLDEYRALCVTLGKQVRILRGRTETLAVAEDIGDDGRLICRSTDGGKFEVLSGDVSVRGLYGYV